MQLVKMKDYEEMSAVAAYLILDKLHSCSETTLGFSTGATPIRTYEILVEEYRKHQTSYSHVLTYNLDEYVGIAPDNPASYHFYMFEHLFKHIDIPKSNIHIPNGIADDITQESVNYEASIDKIGGVDLQLLGIGENGHIGFNEPGTPFDLPTHVVSLTESTRQANAQYFDHYNAIPTHAITMGIATILKSKEIILLASGEKKADALYRMFIGEVSNECPASVLRQHSNVIVLADEEAVLKLEKDMHLSSYK